MMNGQECPFDKTILVATDVVSNGEFLFMPLRVAICHSLFDTIVDDFGVLV